MGTLTECRWIGIGGHAVCLSHRLIEDDEECVWRTLPGRGPVCITPGHQGHGQDTHPLSAEAQRWLQETERHPEILKGKALIKGVSTDELHMNPDGTWKAERVATYHEPIVAEILNPKALPDPGEKPILVLYAGAGGSGKTTALGQYLPYGGGKQAMQRFTVINADDVKDKLPEYTGYNAALVHEESAHIAENLALKAAMRAKQNVLFDGTGKTAAKYLEIADRARKLGYTVQLMYASVDPLTSTQRAVGRFLRMVERGEAKPRYVDPSYLLKVVDAKPDKTYTTMKASGLLDRAVKVDNNGTTPRLLEDVHLRPTAESSDGPGRLPRVAGRAVAAGTARRAGGGEEGHLSEADDCRWITKNGRRICIAGGHAQIRISDAQMTALQSAIPMEDRNAMEEDDRALLDAIHGGHLHVTADNRDRIAGIINNLSNAADERAQADPDPERQKWHRADAKTLANLYVRVLRTPAVRQEADDECRWRTIGGNRVCLTPGHTTGGFAGHAGGAPQYYHGGRRVPAASPEGQQIALLERLTAPDGGFTYDPKTDREPTEGYVVAVHEARSKTFEAKTLTKEDLIGYVDANWDLLAQEGHYLGAWHDPETGKIWLDVPKVVRTNAEAARLAREHQQLAYFDLKAGKSIRVEGGHRFLNLSGLTTKLAAAGTSAREIGAHLAAGAVLGAAALGLRAAGAIRELRARQ